MTQIKATYVDHMGSDLSVVNAARVSFGKESEWDYTCEFEECIKGCKPQSSGCCASDIDGCGAEKGLNPKDKRLIKFLAKHKHLSPFGHAFASFHVKAPIFVARQLVKHKFLRWNEISRRYVDDEPEFYTPDVWRGRAADVKQGSAGEVDLVWGPEHLYEKPLAVYKRMLEAGVAPEQARMVLPQSTMTEWYWSGSLDAFAAMCRLRCAPDTQLESRIAADDISAQMRKLFPVSWAALMGEN
jgi:thymidylate synthase (FAD)